MQKADLMTDTAKMRFIELVTEYNQAAEEQRARLTEMQEILSTRKGYTRVRLARKEFGIGEQLTGYRPEEMGTAASLKATNDLTLPIFDYEPGTE